MMVTKMRISLLLFAAVILGACGKQILSGTEAIPVPTMSILNLAYTLKSIDGHEATVSLSAPDERVQVIDSPSCIGQTGERLRSGHYSFYLQQDGPAPPKKSSVSPFGTEILEFNDHRPHMLEVLPGAEGIQPDLLVVRQYASCNGNLVAVLALSADATQLIQLPFQTSDGLRELVQVSRIELKAPGALRTRSYNNAAGVWTVTEWGLEVPRMIFVATKTESQ